MSTPPLTIRIKKNTDGSAALTCTRADGTVTWQRQLGPNGRFFPLHDLTHYAVETVLGRSRSFYGLIAAGWDISDFGPPYPRGALPEEALVTELIVSFLDAERASAMRWTSAEFAEKARLYYLEHGRQSEPPTLTDDALSRVRQRCAELFERWRDTSPGSALELPFPPDGIATADTRRAGASRSGRR